VEWYEPIRRAIYAFHMPFFLYLSGYVAVLSGALFLPPEKWRRLLASRARRLLLPFLALGLLTVGGKIVAGFFVFVDNRPASLVTGLEICSGIRRTVRRFPSGTCSSFSR
jgi:fucose 4-O-acetylase-like acetyltransferase